MKSALAGTLERARSTFDTISLGQKVVIGLLLAGLGLGGFFFYSWITTPTQAPLFSNLASSDASAIVDELNAQGVPYELADGGATIMVAKDAVYDLRSVPDGDSGPYDFQVVDWKTGRAETTDPLQLAIYRLAWAEVRGVPPERVDAVFYLVATDTVVRPPELPHRTEIARLIAG